MELNRWNHIEQLYFAALEREPGDRDAFLDEACAGDEDLRSEVAGLLACDLPDSFIRLPAIEIAAKALAVDPPIETSTNPTGSLVAGSQIGAYRLLEPLGRGGMGEVHLALDTRLGRKVAVKLLPAEFTADAGRVRRFAREARAASALNHPNIITIHEIGEVRTESGATHYIVTEYVEGETLRQRMANARQGRLCLAEALDMAAQIAAALGAAHEAGITHRDIKPENVMVRPDGLVKVLDFGLAKLTEESQGDEATSGQGDDPIVSPSLPLLISSVGVVMGTPRYMSPEQARGEKVDARTDIFSMGVTLYEIVTGRNPFEGETVSDVIAAILGSEPSLLTEVHPELPSELQRIVSKALAKERDERYQSVNDLERDLENLKKELEFKAALAPAFEDASSDRRSDADAWRSRAFGLIIITTAMTLALALLAYRYWPSRDIFESEILPQLKITLVESWKPEPPLARAVFRSSPDGAQLAFAKVRNGKADIYIKQVNGGEARNLTNDEWNDFSPVWAPDGQSVAYISVRDDKFQVRLIHFGGAGQLLCTLNVVPRLLINWTRDGARIYYEAERNLYALDVANGESRRLTDFPPDSTSAAFAVSADNRWLAYQDGKSNATNLFVKPLVGGAPMQVTREGEPNTTPLWLPDGERLIYRSQRNGVNQICVAFRDGRKPVQITFGHEAMSPQDVTPDGRRIVNISEHIESDVYLLDVRTRAERRFSMEIPAALFPDFAPDGRSVAFQQLRQSASIDSSAIYSKLLKGGYTARVSESGFNPRWSPSGDQIAFLRRNKEDYQLWTARKDGADARAVVKEKVNILGYAQKPYGWGAPPNFSWSPDGCGLVYSSDRTGHSNLYSISAAGTGETPLTWNTDSRLRLFSPIWSPDGKQFIYLGRRRAEGGMRQIIYLYDGAQHRALWQTQTNDEETRLLGWSATDAAVYVSTIISPRVVSPTEVKLLRISTSQSVVGARATVAARFADTYLQNVTLSPKAEHVVYVTRQDNADNIWIAPLPSGRPRRLTVNADPNVGLGCLTWASTANLLGYAKQSDTTSILMIENFK